MKYIITETQLDKVVDVILPFVRRRIDRLDEIISHIENETNSRGCHEFENGDDYANTIIGGSVMDFIGENFSHFEGDGAATKISLLGKMLSDRHYERLVDFYANNCGEE